MPELYHPDLDVTIVVDESRARNRRAAGWVDVDDGGEVVETLQRYEQFDGDLPDPDDTVEDD